MGYCFYEWALWIAKDVYNFLFLLPFLQCQLPGQSLILVTVQRLLFPVSCLLLFRENAISWTFSNIICAVKSYKNFFSLSVYAINSLYAALNFPLLAGWVPIGGDPCGLGWQGVQCVNANITGMYECPYNLTNWFLETLFACKLTISWLTEFSMGQI